MKRFFVCCAVFAAMFFMISCGGGGSKSADGGDSEKNTGELGGECYPNKSCNEGLICDEENNVCIEDPENPADDSDSSSEQTNDDADTASGQNDDDSNSNNPDTTPDNGDSQPDDDADSGDSVSDQDSDPGNSEAGYPCDPNPCKNVANSNNVCSAILDDDGYLNIDFPHSCGCNSGYVWDGAACIKKDLPDCSPTSSTPCLGKYGFIWSKKTTEKMHWTDAVDYCKTLNQENYGGFNDWHLPKIKVLRTLVQNCNSSDGCEGNSDGLYSTLGDIAFLWSSTGGSSEANGIYFYNGTTQSKSVDESFDARCVRRATTSRNVNCSPLYIENTVYNNVSNIPQDYDWEKSEWFPRFTTHYDYEASTTQCRFKCPGNNCKKDLQTGLIWSEKAEEQKNHSDASDYCSTLKENGVQGWDLPNIAKLQTLFPLCFGYEECKYNSLGDKDIYLWTSNNITPNTHTYYYYVYSNGNTDYADPNEKYDVRCARCEVNYFWDSASHKCTPFPESECSSTSATPCRDSSNGLTWSEKPSYTMVWKAAEDYCSGLNSSNYGGYSSGWRLPTIDELRTLLIADRVKNNCQVSGINDCLSSSCWSCGNCTESCTSDDGGATCSDCTYYDDGRYSKFGDTGSFWSYSPIYPIYYYSADVWIVDFGSGYVDFRYNESESSVRCVREGGAPCNKNYFWNGSECVNPCDENPCDGKEHTVSGSCSAISMETFTCKCNSNSFWNGSECVNPCDPNPCNHTGSTGVCTATSDTKFTCGCEDSYFFDSDSGKCLNPCDPNPCNHTGSTGTCNATSATEFSCRCEDNYLFDSDSGKCLNPCDPNPCNHTGSTGTCSATSATKFTCGCKDNYFFDSNSGKCLNPCDSNPCDSLTALTDKTCVAYNFKRYSCAGRDPETNLTWSSIASSDKKWSGAVSYCDNLNESGYTDWRLPTISELRTLIQNCPGTVTGGSCGVVDTGNPSTSCLASSCKTSETCRCDFDNRDGRYSKFGDNNVFWSSSTLSDDTDEAWMLYFSYGEPENVTKTYQYVKVRCVR